MDVCRELNIEDNTAMTIATQWSDDGTITVTILREGTVPLYGKTSVDEQLCEFPRPGNTRDKALAEMRKELSGNRRANGTRFALRGTRFSWKTKAWWKGGLDVRPVEDVATLADMSLKWMNERGQFCDTEYNEERRNDEKEVVLLRKENIELAEKLRVAEITKKRMEQTLYAKFLLLLNEKKNTIRRLEEKLRKGSGENRERVIGERSVPESPYNQETESDNSSDGSSDHVPPSQPDLDIRPTRRPVASNNGHSSKSRSERSYSPESEQDEIVLKYEETPPDHANASDDRTLASPSGNNP